MNDDTRPNPWYREPWPWIILGILGLGWVSGLSILTIGLKNPPEIVSGDYQQLGRALVDTHERTDRARAMGLSGTIYLEGGAIVLELVAADGAALPENLLVQFLHPATSDGDTTALVSRDGDGRYRGELAVSPHGRSRIRVADLSQTWWLGGRLTGDSPGPIDLSVQRI